MAYGAKGERNGLHADGQRQHGFWCTDAEWQSLKAIAEEQGMKPTDLIRAIASGDIAVKNGGRK